MPKARRGEGGCPGSPHPGRHHPCGLCPDTIAPARRAHTLRRPRRARGAPTVTSNEITSPLTSGAVTAPGPRHRGTPHRAGPTGRAPRAAERLPGKTERKKKGGRGEQDSALRGHTPGRRGRKGITQGGPNPAPGRSTYWSGGSAGAP